MGTQGNKSVPCLLLQHELRGLQAGLGKRTPLNTVEHSSTRVGPSENQFHIRDFNCFHVKPGI